MGRTNVHPSAIFPGDSVTVSGMFYAGIGARVRAGRAQVAV